MVSSLQLSTLAKLDLAEIVCFTKETWGVEQADDYVSQMEAGLERVAANLSLVVQQVCCAKGCAD